MEEKDKDQAKQGVRSFIALELSQEAKEEIARIEGILKNSDMEIRWTKPDSAHLTLKFLGDVEENLLAEIGKDLDNITSGKIAFDILLEDIGVFPDWRFPKVMWIGIGEGKDMVSDMAQEVEDAMEKRGFEKEKRPFKPHFTIGRVRRARKKEQFEKLVGTVTIRPVTSRISNIILFKSVLTPKGAVYTPLHISHFFE